MHRGGRRGQPRTTGCARWYWSDTPLRAARLPRRVRSLAAVSRRRPAAGQRPSNVGKRPTLFSARLTGKYDLVVDVTVRHDGGRPPPYACHGWVARDEPGRHDPFLPKPYRP